METCSELCPAPFSPLADLLSACSAPSPAACPSWHPVWPPTHRKSEKEVESLGGGGLFITSLSWSREHRAGLAHTSTACALHRLLGVATSLGCPCPPWKTPSWGTEACGPAGGI